MRVPYQATEGPSESAPMVWGVQIWFAWAVRVGWACDRLHANKMVKFLKGGDTLDPVVHVYRRLDT